jgi:hypothetical protein
MDSSVKFVGDFLGSIPDSGCSSVDPLSASDFDWDCRWATRLKRRVRGRLAGGIPVLLQLGGLPIDETFFALGCETFLGAAADGNFTRRSLVSNSISSESEAELDSCEESFVSESDSSSVRSLPASHWELACGVTMSS